MGGRRCGSGEDSDPGGQPAYLWTKLIGLRVEAIELADLLGAIVDTTSSVCHGPTGLAMQAVGEPTATLGEVRNRADLLIFWGM